MVISVQRSISVSRCTQISVRLEGLQHRLWHSADVVLVVAKRSENTRRIHVLYVSVVTICVAVHVSQFTCKGSSEAFRRFIHCLKLLTQETYSAGEQLLPPTACRMASGAQVSHFLHPGLANT